MKRILLANSIGPYETGWGEDVNDLFSARLTRAQGPFTAKSIFPAFALHLLAENLNADVTIMEWPTEELFHKELKKDYDYLGIQVKSVHLSQIAGMVKIARAVAPDTKIILGGYGVMHIFHPYPNDPLNDAQYLKDNADHFCFEEGVTFFRKIIGQNPDDPISQVRQPMFEVTVQGGDHLARFPLSSTLVSLGCPNACEFCNTSHFFKFKKINVCSPEEAFASLKAASQRMAGQPSLFNMIWDEDFLLDRNYVLRLGELLQKDGLIGKVNLFCFASIKSISQYTVEELVRCGVGVLWIGVESKFEADILANHNFQKRVGRDVREVFEELHNHGILIIGSNILGLDFHNHKNILEDIDYFVSLKPDLYQVSPLRPCPGTTLYDRLMEDGRIEEEFRHQDTMLWSDIGLKHPNFKRGEIQKYFHLEHKRLLETNGPTILSVMDVMFKGYKTMVHSPDPFLQAKAERCYFFGKKLAAGFLPVIPEMIPTPAVRERASQIHEQYRRYVGDFGVKEKVAQRVIGRLMRKRAAMKPPESYTPDYLVTRVKGPDAEPKVVKRQRPVLHVLSQASIKGLRKVLGLREHNAFPIKLKDIDDFPVEFKTMEIEGNRMNYVDEGKGETLLMLHGNPTWSYLYRHFIKDLKKDYRCIALDHLGYGLSDKPHYEDYSMEAHIRRLGAFIEKLGLKDITLICQDWGGIIGLSYAARNKDLFSRLIPMNTTGFLPGSPKEFIQCLGAWAFPYLWSYKVPIAGKKMAMDWNVFLKAGMHLGIVNSKRQLHKRAMDGYLYPFQMVRDRTAIMKSVRQVPMGPLDKTWRLLHDTGRRLAGWNVRTQVIWGMKDPVFVPWFMEKFEEMLPNHAPSVKIATAGHFLQDDEPEIIIREIRRFLKEKQLKRKKGGGKKRAA
ncbi:alpha/beta hydrolase fold protein [Desulfatibacillum aliphaticivorans]|uniref:Alpha/beta hydrolase fold protein n=1 Tax=Desulfatibacillum aliphaticivorans TaxID=218208 RepID=B8FKC5_DESAL|nr:alpha/beta fold hydrolase [Desulfatibacillum aliphaticivorans]ACL01740.1 alpha/beta hydrolase fold protein [Desulfatibacillum aliphaticivorans]